MERPSEKRPSESEASTKLKRSRKTVGKHRKPRHTALSDGLMAKTQQEYRPQPPFSRIPQRITFVYVAITPINMLGILPAVHERQRRYFLRIKAPQPFFRRPL
ncbi:hypothetical protein HMPREF9120_00389 [Neisseria sp. oral taxon 020 str. F0370]|nr:hypothetical protein HMPREF9120_00389 [Neisseria sp. oral taxon 020 str. F0370]